MTFDPSETPIDFRSFGRAEVPRGRFRVSDHRALRRLGSLSHETPNISPRGGYFKIPVLAVRLRRDFSTVLSLIAAHAILHKATRERDDSGAIVATVEDYAAVRDLVADLLSEGVDATVSAAVRETSAAIRDLSAGSEDGTTVARVAAQLRLDKSAASRRIRAAPRTREESQAEARALNDLAVRRMWAAFESPFTVARGAAPFVAEPATAATEAA